jgi:hypothetical protein
MLRQRRLLLYAGDGGQLVLLFGEVIPSHERQFRSILPLRSFSLVSVSKPS